MKYALSAIILGLCCSSPAAAQDIRFAWGQHPSIRAGEWLRVDFRARVQSDTRSSEASIDEDGDSAIDIARRRIGIEGRLVRVIDYQVEYEIGQREWRDVYLDYRQFKAVQVRAGKFKIPFSLDENTSATNLDFVYRSRIASRLASGRDRGVSAHGTVGFVQYHAGVFQNDGANARPAESARVFGGRTSVARLILDPFRGSKSPLSDFHVGFAISRTTVPEGFPAVRARTVFGEPFFDSDVWVKGRRQRAGLEARWRPGPFSLQAEYIRLTDERRGQGVDDGDLPPLLAEGWYVSGTFAVTGERKSDGLDNPRRPFQPFFKGSGIGAVEVAARLERLSFGSKSTGDLSTSPRAEHVPGNSDLALTLGLNWYVNRWVKIQANLIREQILDPSLGPEAVRLKPDTTTQGVFWSRVFRLQFSL